MDFVKSRRRSGGLGSLPVDPLGMPESLAPKTTAVWAQRVWAMATLSGLAAALILVLAVAVGIVPMFFGFRTFVVVSGSMEPTIATGSIAITAPIPSQKLQVGDVIAFSPSSDAALPIIHRIVKVDERDGARYVTTRGDANTSDDAPLALPAKGLLVIATVPLVGYAVYYAAQPFGTLVLVWVPLILLAVLWLKDRLVKSRQARQP